MPRRRCVGCGRTAPKSELVRMVAASVGPEHRLPIDWIANRPAVALVDRGGTMPGRGAYLCRSRGSEEPRAECMRLALRKGGLARALRRAVEIPVEPAGAGSLESEGR